MNEIQVFTSSEFGKIRSVELGGEPWLVGVDVASALGYSNPSKAILHHVDDDDKRFLMLDSTDSQNGNLCPSQTKTALINESGLYSLIFGSRMDGAKRFKRWVTSEVLPSIRKYGAFAGDDVRQLIRSEVSRQLDKRGFFAADGGCGPAAGVDYGERAREIGALAREAAELCGVTSRKMLHCLYGAIESQLGLSLSQYAYVYRSETGHPATTLEVVAAFDRLYEQAVWNLNDLIQWRKLFC